MTFTVTPQLQPDGSGMCGQVCVQMAAGVTLAEASAAVGVSALREAGTTADDLVRGLKALGLKTGKWVNYCNRAKRMKRLPKFAIISITDNKSKWGHWVLVKDGFVFDPALGWPMPVHVYELAVIEGAYSRTFRPHHLKHRNVHARWEEVIPILSYPKEKT